MMSRELRLCSLLPLLVVVSHLTGEVEAWLPPPKGDITLESHSEMFYVGENLTALCNKFSNFTGEVRFLQGNVYFSQEYVTRINNTHALLDKPTTAEDWKETVLQCVDGDGLVASTTIYTDYTPQNATGFQMVWLDETNLLIDWGFNGTPYKNGHSKRLIKVTGEWSYNPTDASSWQVCYNGTLEKAGCDVTGITDEWATVYVRVNITNVKRKDTASTVFPGVRIREHVKPSAPTSVSAMAVDSTTAKVTVTAAQHLLAYNITYYRVVGNGTIINTKTVMIKKTDDKSFNITGLHPDYTYHFEVRSKLYDDRGYLSDLAGSIPTVRMPEDAPSAAPDVELGSFLFDNSTCTYGTSSDAKLYIYYKELAEEYKNGVIVRHTATVDGINATFIQPGPARTLKLDSVPCNDDFNVAVHACTAVGCSPPFVLHVPEMREVTNKIAVQPKVTVSVGETVNVSVEPKQPPQSHYVLFYCETECRDIAMCRIKYF